MPRHDAASVGFLVPPAPWAGRVAGVHSGAVALLASDGALVSIVADPSAMECRAVRVDAAAFEALRGHLEGADGAGGETLADSGALRVGGFELGLAGSPTWDPRERLASAAGTIAGSIPRDLLRSLGELLAAAVSDEGIRGGGAFGRAFAALREAGDFPANLVGFGPGSTPAGDDFLAGWLLAGALAGKAPEPAIDASRTTPAGRALLLQTCRGGFPESQVALAEALASDIRDAHGRPKATLEAGRELLRHGASSGADTLQGFLERALSILAEKGKKLYRWYP